MRSACALGLAGTCGSCRCQPRCLWISLPNWNSWIARGNLCGWSVRTAVPSAGRFEYGEIPQPLVQATLAAEDRRFWRHPGVDWRATGRAAWQWVRHRRVVSGGSTITQQLIKLAQPRPRNLRTKLIEAAQALRLEQVWDKQRILAAYLNRLDYGNFNRGCAAAADFYFGKPLSDLSPAECALLAGLPQAPSRLNPHTHFDRAVKRQQWILGQMRQAGWLTSRPVATRNARNRFIWRPLAGLRSPPLR